MVRAAVAAPALLQKHLEEAVHDDAHDDPSMAPEAGEESHDHHEHEGDGEPVLAQEGEHLSSRP